MQLSQKLKILLQFCCIFGIYIKFWTFWKKNESHNLRVSEIIDSERCGYFNERKVLFMKSPRHPKIAEIYRKALLFYFFIILSQIELEKVIFSHIWYFRTACWHVGAC